MFPQGLYHFMCMHNVILDEMEQVFWERAYINEHRSLWPRRCYQSRKWIWFKKSIMAQATWTGPGEPVVEERWYDQKEYMLMKLKGQA